MAAFGTDATIVFLSKLPDASRVVDDLLEIADQVTGPLGVYECPVPEHRLLSAADVGVLAKTGRFIFMKETSRNRDPYHAKLLAAEGSPLKVFQANWGELPGSLDVGAPGFCGIIANMFPELVNAFCNNQALSAVVRKSLHEILADALLCITRRHYPATMKYLLQRRGVSINTISRIAGAQDVDDEDVQRLESMLEDLQLLRSPFETLAALGERTFDVPHEGLKGPHRSPEWAQRTWTSSPPDID
jgi:4-hydroxy-tetrahydrodipicolinate synthase